MAVGKGAAGKTSIRKRLMGERIDLQHIITNALETQQCNIDIANMNQAWSKYDKDRKDLLEEEITEKISKCLRSDPSFSAQRPLPERPPVSLPPLAEGDVDSCSQKKKTRLSKLFGFLKRGNRKSNDMTENTYEQILDQNLDPDTVGKEAKQQKDKGKEKLLGEEDKSRLEVIAEGKDDFSKRDYSLIRFWDFGGQKVYYILHTVFLRVTCVYILVLDLSREISNNQHASKEHPSLISDPDFDSFRFWLNTILSHQRKQGQNRDTRKNVIVVGTHLDQLHSNKEEQKRLASRYFQELKSKLKTKQHKNLVISFYAVDNVGDDNSTYERLRKALIDAVIHNCNWGEMRPIRWLQMTKALQLMLEDQSLSQIDKNLISFKRVQRMASKYNMNTEEDVKVYLRFSHTVGDITYFDVPGLKDFIIPDPQWLSNVFRAVITVDNFYPDESFPEDEIYKLDKFKKAGLLELKGDLLSRLWKPFLQDSNENEYEYTHEDEYEDTQIVANKEAENEYENIQKGANKEAENEYENTQKVASKEAAQETEPVAQQIIDFLLALMVQFDLIVPLSDEWCLVPCLLPFSRKPSKISFKGMKPVTPSLYLMFHSSTESYGNFKASCPTGDEFLPHGFFHRLISRCTKLEWTWTGEKCQDAAYFLVDNCKIGLTTKSTWIKIDIWFPNACLQVFPYKYFKEIMSEISSLIYTYSPNMWAEYSINTCANFGHECLQSIGVTSLGGREHLIECLEHHQQLVIEDFSMWYKDVPYQLKPAEAVKTQSALQETIIDRPANPSDSFLSKCDDMPIPGNHSEQVSQTLIGCITISPTG